MFSLQEQRKNASERGNEVRGKWQERSTPRATTREKLNRQKRERERERARAEKR